MYGLAKRHDISRNLIRVLIEKYGAGVRDDLDERRIASFIDVPAKPSFASTSCSRCLKSADPVAAQGAPVASSIAVGWLVAIAPKRSPFSTPKQKRPVWG